VSIDFNVGVVRNFTAEAFVHEVRRRVVDLTGAADSQVTAKAWALSSDFGAQAPGMSEGMESLLCGPDYPDRWIELSIEPKAQAYVSVMSLEDPARRHADLETSPVWRNPSSVVLAIAAVIAGADVGGGDFDSNIDRILGERVSEPNLLTDRLRTAARSGEDFESVSRRMLRATPAFATWSVLEVEQRLLRNGD
jgi:hypothetical protein